MSRQPALIEERRDGSHPADSIPRRPIWVLAFFGMAGGLLLAWFFAGGTALETESNLLMLAGPVGVALGLVAVTRFEWFVWTVLLVRPSLDVASSVGLGPGAMLAVVFMVTSGVWLAVQYRAGQLQPLSAGTKWLLGLAGVAALSTVTSIVRVASIQAVLEILAGVTMFVVLEQLLPERRDRLRRLIIVVLCSAVVPALVGLRQWATGDGLAVYVETPRVYGTFVHPSPFATYLVLVMILAISLVTLVTGRRRVLLLGFVALLAVNLMATDARSAWMAFVVSLAYVGFRRSKLLLVGLVCAAAGAALFVPSVSARISDLGDDRWVPEGVPANSLEWRIQYWGELIPLANESPITGLGPQSVISTRPEALEPHNVFVQAYVELGALGLTALLIAIVMIGVTLRSRRRSATTSLESALAVGAVACTLAILVQAPSENLLNATMTWWYLAACATWGFSERRAADAESAMPHDRDAGSARVDGLPWSAPTGSQPIAE